MTSDAKLYDFFVIRLSNLLNNSCRWSAPPWHGCDVTVKLKHTVWKWQIFALSGYRLLLGQLSMHSAVMRQSTWRTSLITRFMEPTWGPSGADRTQVGPMLAPCTLISGLRCPFNYPFHYLSANLFLSMSIPKHTKESLLSSWPLIPA